MLIVTEVKLRKPTIAKNQRELTALLSLKKKQALYRGVLRFLAENQDLPWDAIRMDLAVVTEIGKRFKHVYYENVIDF